MEPLWPPRPAEVCIYHDRDSAARSEGLAGLLRERCARSVSRRRDLDSPLDDIGRGRLDLLVVATDDDGSTLEALEQLLWQVPVGDHVPAVVVTRSVDPEFHEAAFDLGAADVLVEPFDDLELCRRVRSHLGARLVVASLKRQAAELTEELEARSQTLDAADGDLLGMLRLALRLRDPVTGAHAERIGSSAAVLGVASGLSAASARHLRLAAPLHDIGKLAIPDAILLKPGPLSAEERRVVERHTLLGARLLRFGDGPVVRLAAAIALAHHERWDGSGYPYGLAGEGIPAAARITAVVDVFDALVHERPYKPAWPVVRAVEELERMAGTHLDPHLVDVFLREDLASVVPRADDTDPVTVLVDRKAPASHS